MRFNNLLSQQTFEISFELLLKYLNKSDKFLENIINCLTNNYSYKYTDISDGFYRQKVLSKKLWKMTNDGESYLYSRLFIIYAKKLLEIQHNTIEQNGKHSLTTIRFNITPCSDILKLRGFLIECLFSLKNNSECENTANKEIIKYIDGLRLIPKEFIESDISYIATNISEKFDKTSLIDCLSVSEVKFCCEFAEISNYLQYFDGYFHEQVDFSRCLVGSSVHKSLLDLDYEAYEAYKRSIIDQQHSNGNFTFDYFCNFLDLCVNLNCYYEGRLRHELRQYLYAVEKNNPTHLVKCVLHYLPFNDIFNLSLTEILQLMFKVSSAKTVYSNLQKVAVKDQVSMMTAFYTEIVEDEVTEEISSGLINHFDSLSEKELPSSMGFLKKYIKYKKNIFTDIAGMLLNKSYTNISFAMPFCNLFMQYYPFFNEWFTKKGNNLLIQKAYIQASIINGNMDFDGMILKDLVTNDSSFLYKYLDKLYEVKSLSTNYSNRPKLNFLWAEDNSFEKLDKLAFYIQEKDEFYYNFGDNAFALSFHKEAYASNKQKFTSQHIEYFKYTIRKNYKNKKHIIFIFSTIGFKSFELRLDMFLLLLSFDIDLEIFEKLINCDRIRSGGGKNGSFISSYESDYEFLTGLYSKIGFSLNYLEHRKILAQKLDDVKLTIKSIKRDDFSKDF